MKKLAWLLLMFGSSLTQPLLAQTPQRVSSLNEWEKNPKLSNITIDTSYHAVIIFSIYDYEYLYENDYLYEYKNVHRKIKPLTDAGIEDYNKVYIPLTSDEAEIVYVKARVIKNDSTTYELKKDDFKFAYNEENGTKYQYFAFEGIELGCEIEYMYCQKKQGIHSGIAYILQAEDSVLYARSSFTTPDNLILKLKGINGCPQVERDTTLFKKNKWAIVAKNIPGMKEEFSSAYNALHMGFLMKLDRNLSTGKKDIYSYGPLVTNIYDNIYNQLESKDEKLIDNFLDKINVDATSEEGKIRIIENYIKTNFIYSDEGSDPDKKLIAKIISNKTFNMVGAIRLYANIFKKMGIEIEIVGTSNRFRQKFDKEFECYDLLETYMIYFPSIKKYLVPGDNLSRLGFPDSDYINNYGLFIKTVSMGNFNTGVGKIKFISGAPYQESADVLKVDAILSEDFSNNKYIIERQLTGYVAGAYQPIFDFVKEEDELKEFSELVIKYIDENGEVSDLAIENKGGNNLGQKPLIAKATLKSDLFIEKAGAKYLFNVGLLIGPQLELYKKEARKLPLEFDYNHFYHRTITFKVPANYRALNLEGLKINEIYIRNGNDTTMGFNSDYIVVDDKVTITISEYYKEYNYALTEFEDYRRVANAAANFNKVTLIFEPK